MPSLQSQVTKLLIDDNTLTLDDIKKKFPNSLGGTLRSCYSRGKVKALGNAGDATPNEKITMERMEALLVKQLKKKSDVASLRLAIDFLKIKQQDQSEMQEIDLGMFYKKAMET